MKYALLGCFTFALYMCQSDAKEVRQISSLVPLDDWIDFKNRTRDIKPIDKFIGKLRATYDFVFHKSDNVTNVEKILDKAAEEGSIKNIQKINITNSIGENDTTIERIDGRTSMKLKLSENRPVDENFEKKLQTLEDALPLDRLEIIDDHDSPDRFDDETEQLDSTMQPAHSKFQLPYAIAQALLRWIISLYFSTTSPSTTPIDTVAKEGV